EDQDRVAPDEHPDRADDEQDDRKEHVMRRAHCSTSRSPANQGSLMVSPLVRLRTRFGCANGDSPQTRSLKLALRLDPLFRGEIGGQVGLRVAAELQVA